VALAITLMGVSRVGAAPTTAPSAPGAKQQAPDVQDTRPRVLVMPFDELADAPKRDWVGKAMQQSLVAELTRTGAVSVVTPPADAPSAKDPKDIAKLARDLGAALVVTGAYQIVDQDLRVTGQMLESINGEPIAAIKATGNLRDLFSIEDQIGNQVRRDLQAILNPQPANPGQRPGGDPFNVQPSGPVQQQPPTGSYTGSDLQRSLDDQWAPPEPTYQDRYDRYRYSYPPPYYYPPYGYYDYYDWCGYTFRPGRIITTVPAGPQAPFSQQNNNYITAPGQLGRTSGGNFVQGPPGQMGRTGASRGNSNSIQSPPGQMGRTGGNTSAGSHSSTGAPGQMRGSR
jgi:TolB-like protein